MCCLLTILLFLGPRIAGIIWWIAQPGPWVAAFNTWPISYWIWPILGLLFLPFTTLMFVLVAPTGQVVGFDWFWLILALIIDLGSYGGGGYGNRGRLSR